MSQVTGWIYRLVANHHKFRRGQGGKPAAASRLIQRIDELTIATSGSFWHAEGYQLPW